MIYLSLQIENHLGWDEEEAEVEMMVLLADKERELGGVWMMEALKEEAEAREEGLQASLVAAKV